MPGNWADASQLHPALNSLLPSYVIQTDTAPSDPLVPRPMAYMMSQSLQIPEAIRTGTEGPAFEMAYRVPVARDPAVRQFHAGDTIAYESRLFAADQVQPNVMVQILGEGRPVHSEPIALQGAEIRGTYHMDPDTPPGRYLLGLTAEEQPGKKNARTSSQWIDFEVVK
jgi:hypothetical protein